MNAALAIGLAAGAVSALLFAAPISGTWLGLTLVLFYLAPLPNLIAGLGWGHLSAVLAGAGGVAVTGLGVGPVTGASYALALGAPAVLLSRLAHFSRSVEGEPGAVDWYPTGRLIAVSTLFAATLGTIVAIAVGWDGEAWPKMIEQMFREGSFAELVRERGLSDEEIKGLGGLIARGLPAACSVIWLATTIFNLWAADRIVQHSGRALRPRLDFSDVELPSGFPMILAGALALSFVPGIVGMAATGFLSALLFAYFIVGLGIAHLWARGRSHGGFVLAVIYGAIILFGWVAILIAVMGLAEPLLHLRQRAMRPPSNPSSPNS